MCGILGCWRLLEIFTSLRTYICTYEHAGTEWTRLEWTMERFSCMCIFVYTYIYIYAAHLYVCTFSDPELRIHYIRIALRVYIYISSYVLTCMYTYTYMYNMYMYMCMCIYIYMYIYACVSLSIYIYIYIHIMYTYVYTYTYCAVQRSAAQHGPAQCSLVQCSIYNYVYILLFSVCLCRLLPLGVRQVRTPPTHSYNLRSLAQIWGKDLKSWLWVGGVQSWHCLSGLEIISFWMFIQAERGKPDRDSRRERGWERERERDTSHSYDLRSLTQIWVKDLKS